MNISEVICEGYNDVIGDIFIPSTVSDNGWTHKSHRVSPSQVFNAGPMDIAKGRRLIDKWLACVSARWPVRSRTIAEFISTAQHI